MPRWVRPISSPALSIGTPGGEQQRAEQVAHRRGGAARSTSSSSVWRPRRRGSTTGCRRCRRGCPRRWPRCACARRRRRSAQGEAVVGGDEVDRGDRAAAARAEQVLGPGEPGRQLAHAVAGLAVRGAGDVGSQNVADAVAEPVVPLRPTAAGTGRLRQPCTPTSHGSAMSLTRDSTGSLRMRDEERVVAGRTVVRGRGRGPTARSNRNPSTWHLADPVAQRVQHQPADHGVAQVEGVAAAGDVDVAWPRSSRAVVGRVVQAAPGQRRRRRGRPRRCGCRRRRGSPRGRRACSALTMSLNSLDLTAVRAGGGGVGGVRGEEAQGVVAPVVDQPALGQVPAR